MTKDGRSDLKKALIEALNSQEGQTAMKKAALDALKTKEADELLFDFFMKAFREVILPGLDHLQEDVDLLKEDVGNLKMDVNYLKESAVKRDRFIDNMKEKLFRRA